MFDLASLHEVTCHCEIVPTIFKCASRRLPESSSVRVQRIIGLKIGWTVFMSVVSHGFKIG